MGTIAAQSIVDRARHILQDTTSGGTRWLDDELMKWLNDAQREIVLLKPNAFSSVEGLTLESGSRQDITAEGLLLLSVVRNVDGRAVRRVDRNILDSENPDWHETTAQSSVEHYVFDEDAPTVFWVYPPNTGTGQVEVIVSKAPVDVAAIGSVITLNDIYMNVILDYMLYRAYSKDTDYAGNTQRAGTHYSAFNNSLGVKLQGEQASSPNQNVRTSRAAGSS
jgi:hypothetical protein